MCKKLTNYIISNWSFSDKKIISTEGNKIVLPNGYRLKIIKMVKTKNNIFLHLN